MSGQLQDIPEHKKALRRQMRETIRSHAPGQLRQADAILFRKLCEDPGVRDAELVLCYYGMPGEPATREFMQEMFRQGKRVALPKCDPARNGKMEFHEIRGLSSQEIRPGMYGIPEPVQEDPVNFKKNNNIMIVPGLAFTSSGDRLGRGGGYYDRFLQDHPDLEKIGLCYDFMILPEIPGEIHDAYSHVDRIVHN